MPLPLDAHYPTTTEPERRRRRRILPILLILIGLGAAGGIGWTLATNTITLNGSSNIELGQGTQATVACDTAVTVSLTQSWDNTLNGFTVTEVVVSNYDFASGCAAKTLTFVLVDSSDDKVTNGEGSLKVSAGGVTSSLGGNVASAVAAAGTVTITLTTEVPASSVAKVAIQTA